MNKQLVINQSAPAKRRFSPLVIAALIAYLLIFNAVIIYIKQPAKYASEFSLVLPGTGSSSKVVLDEVGQVSQSSTSAFNSGSYNPRSNYKQILQSDAVREIAAASLGIPESHLQIPKIELIEQTSIINVLSKAGSAKQANAQAWAIYEALQQELDRLRVDEANRHDLSIERMLDQHRERLNNTRKAIVDFQQRSLLITQSQIEGMVTMLAKVRDDLTFTESERKAQTRFVNQLSMDLGVSPALAGHALTLQSDSEFKGYITELDQTAAQMSRFESQWGKNHPKVVVERQRYQVVLANLKERSSEIVGVHSAEILHGMDLSASDRLSELFSTLLDTGARLQGMQAKLDDLRLSEIRLDDQLRIYARESAELERLQREHQRAEAVFSSAAARLEAGKTDVFGSYPLVQLLAAPGMGESNSQSRVLIAIALGLFGFVMVTLAVLVIWQRDRLISLLLKRS